MAKLTDKQWLEIKTKYSLNIPLRKIADDYNTSASTISRKANAENWEILSQDKISQAKNIELHQEFNQYINTDIEKLKIIRDIFTAQSLMKNTQIITFKESKKGIREKAALDTIEQLLGIKLIRQFTVGGFRIDGYDVDNKIAYEIDEEQHNNKKHSQHDILRQKFIEEQLQCKFVRIKV